MLAVILSMKKMHMKKNKVKINENDKKVYLKKINRIWMNNHRF